MGVGWSHAENERVGDSLRAMHRTYRPSTALFVCAGTECICRPAFHPSFPCHHLRTTHVPVREGPIVPHDGADQHRQLSENTRRRRRILRIKNIATPDRLRFHLSTVLKPVLDRDGNNLHQPAIQPPLHAVFPTQSSLFLCV